jgi:hypothetical protein
MKKQLLFHEEFKCQKCPFLLEHDHAPVPNCWIDEKDIPDILNPPTWCKLREGSIELHEHENMVHIYLNPKP